MSVVGIILARGGSKRLPRKNTRECAGKPLIAYTIEAAQGAKSLSRTIVSTNDPEVARIAAAYGADVPFERPAEFSMDTSPSIDALSHAVSWLQANAPPIDAVVLLQPTSPLRQSRHIDEAVALYRSMVVDTVSAVSIATAHPYWCWKPDGLEIRPFFSAEHVAVPRQQLPPALIENGALYVVRCSVLSTGSLYGERVAGYMMDAVDAVDIDTIDDFEYAEFLIQRRAKQVQPTS